MIKLETREQIKTFFKFDTEYAVESFLQDVMTLYAVRYIWKDYTDVSDLLQRIILRFCDRLATTLRNDAISIDEDTGFKAPNTLAMVFIRNGRAASLVVDKTAIEKLLQRDAAKPLDGGTQC